MSEELRPLDYTGLRRATEAILAAVNHTALMKFGDRPERERERPGKLPMETSSSPENV